MKSKPNVVGDQVDRHTKVPKPVNQNSEKAEGIIYNAPATSANPVEISLSHLWEVEVDDHVDGLDVDTSGKEVAAHEITTQASSEIMENPVPVSLGHLGVDVVAGVTKFGDLLGQQLNPLCRIAKNDALPKKREIKIHLSRNSFILYSSE